MDWSGVGREGEAGALNAQLAGAFRVAARLALALGWAREAERLRARARAIGEALEVRHWDARRGVYVDIVDPVTGAQDLRISQHANAAIALWGEADRPAAGARARPRSPIPRRLTFTAGPPIAPKGETLDPEEGVVLANTFYSHFVYEALGGQGRFADALRLMRERFGPMLDKGATTLWESFAPTASLCHGFSASPTHQLSRRMLGVAPAEPGFAEIVVRPDLAGLELRRWRRAHPPRRRRGAARTRAGRLRRPGATGRTAYPIELAAAPGLALIGRPGAFEARFGPEP